MLTCAYSSVYPMANMETTQQHREAMAKRIKAIQEEVGGLEPIAQKLHVDYITVSRWARGITYPRQISIHMLEVMEKELGLVG